MVNAAVALKDDARLVFIGTIRTPWTSRLECPRQGRLDGPDCRIAVDEPANLCLVDLDATWIVGEDGYESRSENSCFAGRELHGRVLLTVAAGSVAYRERAFAVAAAPEPGRDAP